MTQGDIAKKARAKGYEVDPKTLGAMAQKGLIPFAKKNPHTRGLIFPKEKFMEVLKAAKKSAVLRKGSFTKYGLVQEAKRRGLTIEAADIDTHLKRIKAGKEPMPKGLATDLFHSKRRLIIPKKFAQQLLKEAEIRKRLPQLLKQGKLIPISRLATELGLSKRSLHPRKDLKKIRIGNGLYVTKAEAIRFKKHYLSKVRHGPKTRGIARKRKAEGLPAKAAVKKRTAAKKKPVVEKAPAKKSIVERKPVEERKTKEAKKPARLPIPVLPKELANTGTSLLTTIKAFEQKSLEAIELVQRFPLRAEARAASEKALASRIGEWEQRVEAVHRKLVAWRTKNQATTGGLIEENNLEIAGKTLKIVRLFLEGKRENDNAVKAQRKGIESLQFRNKALKAGEEQ